MKFETLNNAGETRTSKEVPMPTPEQSGSDAGQPPLGVLEAEDQRATEKRIAEIKANLGLDTKTKPEDNARKIGPPVYLRISDLQSASIDSPHLKKINEDILRGMEPGSEDEMNYKEAVRVKVNEAIQDGLPSIKKALDVFGLDALGADARAKIKSDKLKDIESMLRQLGRSEPDIRWLNDSIEWLKLSGMTQEEITAEAFRILVEKYGNPRLAGSAIVNGSNETRNRLSIAFPGIMKQLLEGEKLDGRL